MRSNGRRGNAGNEGRREGRAVLLSSSIRPDPAVARERSRRHLLPSPRDNLLDIYPSSIHPREIAGVILFERSKKLEDATLDARRSRMRVCALPRVRQTFADPVSMIKLAINRGREGIISLFGGR